jgi:hypothetical protein
VVQPSLLSDELVHELMAVGQVDILVGIPTLNNAATIAGVVRAVHQAFGRFFPRDRTVLINSDGGSEDGTRTIVRNLSLDETDTLTVRHSLRTVHRISAPYHGVPGKGSALRQIFAAADLLQARAVAVLDPDVTTVEPGWVEALIAPVRSQGFEFVVPIYSRHPLDGPLVSQLVRPLMRAAYGVRLAEPQAAEFGCSGRFAAACVEHDVWDTGFAQYGIDLWLTAQAISGQYRVCEAPLGPRAVAPGPNRPGLTATFEQVVGSLFTLLDTQSADWLSRSGSEGVPRVGPAPPPPLDATPIDGERLLQSVGSDIRDLQLILQTILDPETGSALAEVAREQPAQLYFPDDLWTATVHQFLAAYHESVIRREHITQALLPVYLARAGSFVLHHEREGLATIESALEALCLQFERAKPRLVQRWTGAPPR